MNIISVFSGRRGNIEILRKYLALALQFKIIDEVHFWNNTRNTADEIYLKSISNLRRSSSTAAGNYIQISPKILNNSFEISAKAPNDIHIKITNNKIEYEIVIGGWSNTKSVIRENNQEIHCLNKNGLADATKFNKYQVTVDSNMLFVKKNNEIEMIQAIEPEFLIENVFFKTGHSSIGHLTYDTTKDNGFYFMDTCEKNWKNYYNYYNDKMFENDIIMKCDDDIVFIDLLKLPRFIEFIKNNDYDLVFANTINNGVASHFQQSKYNLIPRDLMELEYPNGGLCGSLWENGVKAEKLHIHFIENYNKFIDYNYNYEIIPINTRYSINFFGFKGKHWYKIIDACGVCPDDEYNLTVEFVKTKQFQNILYSDFYVSHLSFYKQIETGINLDHLLDKYNKFYNMIETSGRFTLVTK